MVRRGGEEEEQDVMSVHSPCKAPPSSASSLSKVSRSPDIYDSGFGLSL